jgi:hypothetical protein
MLTWQEIREFYGREVVNLRNEGRWVFLNTLFSVSEAVMYMQVGTAAERLLCERIPPMALQSLCSTPDNQRRGLHESCWRGVGRGTLRTPYPPPVKTRVSHYRVDALNGPLAP